MRGPVTACQCLVWRDFSSLLHLAIRLPWPTQSGSVSARTGMPSELNDLWSFDVGSAAWTHAGGWPSARWPRRWNVRGQYASGGIWPVRHPELKVSAPAHEKHLGWYVDVEFRVAQGARQGPAVWPAAEPGAAGLWLFGGSGAASTDSRPEIGLLSDLWRFDGVDGWDWVAGSDRVNSIGVYTAVAGSGGGGEAHDASRTQHHHTLTATHHCDGTPRTAFAPHGQRTTLVQCGVCFTRRRSLAGRAADAGGLVAGVRPGLAVRRTGLRQQGQRRVPERPLALRRDDRGGGSGRSRWERGRLAVHGREHARVRRRMALGGLAAATGRWDCMVGRVRARAKERVFVLRALASSRVECLHFNRGVLTPPGPGNGGQG